MCCTDLVALCYLLSELRNLHTSALQSPMTITMPTTITCAISSTSFSLPLSALSFASAAADSSSKMRAAGARHQMSA